MFSRHKKNNTILLRSTSVPKPTIEFPSFKNFSHDDNFRTSIFPSYSQYEYYESTESLELGVCGRFNIDVDNDSLLSTDAVKKNNNVEESSSSSSNAAKETTTRRKRQICRPSKYIWLRQRQSHQQNATATGSDYLAVMPSFSSSYPAISNDVVEEETTSDHAANDENISNRTTSDHATIDENISNSTVIDDLEVTNVHCNDRDHQQQESIVVPKFLRRRQSPLQDSVYKPPCVENTTDDDDDEQTMTTATEETILSSSTSHCSSTNHGEFDSVADGVDPDAETVKTGCSSSSSATTQRRCDTIRDSNPTTAFCFVNNHGSRICYTSTQRNERQQQQRLKFRKTLPHDNDNDSDEVALVSMSKSQLRSAYKMSVVDIWYGSSLTNPNAHEQSRYTQFALRSKKESVSPQSFCYYTPDDDTKVHSRYNHEVYALLLQQKCLDRKHDQMEVQKWTSIQYKAKKLLLQLEQTNAFRKAINKANNNTSY